MSSEGVNSLEKNADAHRVGCSFSEHHTGLEVVQSAEGSQSLCGRLGNWLPQCYGVYLLICGHYG